MPWMGRRDKREMCGQYFCNTMEEEEGKRGRKFPDVLLGKKRALKENFIGKSV